MPSTNDTVEAALAEERDALLEEWTGLQVAAPGFRSDLITSGELRVESERFLDALAVAVRSDSADEDISGPEWSEVRETLTELSRTRAAHGFSPTETATFILSLKQPLFERLRRQADDSNALADTLWSATTLLDRLGLFTAEAYLRSREDVIRRQQDELLELSTPVVEVFDGVVALPLIGTLDSNRTQVVMESLLERIVETDSTIAILDITGVPTVDTLVAQHLLRTVAAARLMGADCIISGIRPQIAQTIVHLGLDLSSVITKASLADALQVALDRTGFEILASRHVGLAMPDTTERIPILKLGRLLLVTIQVDMHDRMAVQLQDDLTQQIVKHRAHGVLIDISGLELVDSFIGRMLSDIAAMARVLDADTVVVGMRPAVAITLVELGLSLPGVGTALTVERGMDMLRREDGRTTKDGDGGGDADLGA